MKLVSLGPTYSPSAEQLDLITEVIASVAGHRRLSVDDAPEFRQATHLRLLQRNYDMFLRQRCKFAQDVPDRRHAHVCRLAARALWQMSNISSGETAWTLCRRPRFSRRLGRYSPQEAVRVVRRMQGAPTDSLFERMVEELPRRSRRRHVSDYELTRHPSVPFADPLEALLEAGNVHRRLRTAVRDAMASLSDDDRRLFEARSLRRQKVRTLTNVASHGSAAGVQARRSCPANGNVSR